MWKRALRFGFTVSLLQRVLLLLWMVLIWVGIAKPLALPIRLEPDAIAQLPVLDEPFEQAVLGVWRRWDAGHYLNLSQNGYRALDVGPTVFSPLAPVSIGLLSRIIGNLDLAGMIFSTLAFGVACGLLYAWCALDDVSENLSRWAVLLLAVLPHAFFFQAPISESAYLAATLGLFYAARREKWLLAGLCGALAALARQQGVLLAAFYGLMLLGAAWDKRNVREPVGAGLVPPADEGRGSPAPLQNNSNWAGAGVIGRTPYRPSLQDALRSLDWGYLFRNGWPALLIVAAWWGFIAYRAALGLPSLNDTYYQYSYIGLTDPLNGLLLNLRWLAAHPSEALFNPDVWALLVSTGLLLGYGIRKPRQWLLSAYCAAFLLLFVSKVTYMWGGDYSEIINTQSVARYTLALFPLTIWLAESLSQMRLRWRMAWLLASGIGLLAFSAIFTLGGGSP